MTAPPPHPGTIVFVDADTGEERSQPVASVPEPLRYAPDQRGQLVPVVRVVAQVAGNTRQIHELGPEGQLLRSTTQLRS